VNFSHIPKFEIFRCDKATLLKESCPRDSDNRKRNLGNSVESLEKRVGSSLRVGEECVDHHGWGVLSWVGNQLSQLKVVGCFLDTNC
jgi:hypothetical protein